MTKTLDLGCGTHPKNPFNADEVYGVDIRDLGGNIRAANLALDPIPFEDNSFDFVTAHDFIEHIPRVLAIYNPQTQRNETINPFIRLMNEIWRVLKVGGHFYSRTPAYPHADAFQDPTHVNIITEQTFPLYFNDHYPVGHIYGFEGGFQIASQDWEGCHLRTVLIKSEKPDLSRFGANAL
jgi:SAM-dependent methyltransferase